MGCIEVVISLDADKFNQALSSWERQFGGRAAGFEDAIRKAILGFEAVSKYDAALRVIVDDYSALTREVVHRRSPWKNRRWTIPQSDTSKYAANNRNNAIRLRKKTWKRIKK